MKAAVIRYTIDYYAGPLDGARHTYTHKTARAQPTPMGSLIVHQGHWYEIDELRDSAGPATVVAHYIGTCPHI